MRAATIGSEPGPTEIPQAAFPLSTTITPRLVNVPVHRIVTPLGM